MNESIESVNNLPKPTVNNKVQQVDRSKQEKDQKTFDEELKEKLKKKKESDVEDTLIIEQTELTKQNKDEEKNDEDKSEDRQEQPADEENEDDNPDSEQSPHIDLKI